MRRLASGFSIRATRSSAYSGWPSAPTANGSPRGTDNLTTTRARVTFASSTRPPRGARPTSRSAGWRGRPGVLARRRRGSPRPDPAWWSSGTRRPRTACGPSASTRASSSPWRSALMDDPSPRRTRDQTVRIWDTITGSDIRTLYGQTGFVRAVAFAPDGRSLASASEDGTVTLWESNTGREIAAFPRTHPGGPGCGLPPGRHASRLRVQLGSHGEALGCGQQSPCDLPWS